MSYGLESEEKEKVRRNDRGTGSGQEEEVEVEQRWRERRSERCEEEVTRIGEVGKNRKMRKRDKM